MHRRWYYSEKSRKKSERLRELIHLLFICEGILICLIIQLWWYGVINTLATICIIVMMILIFSLTWDINKTLKWADS